MRADEHRRSSGHDLSHQGDCGDAATFVEGRHGLVEDKKALASMDQSWKQGAEHADFPALTLGERKHAIVQTVTKIHALGQLGQCLVGHVHACG